jgi:hypothetical protein
LGRTARRIRIDPVFDAFYQGFYVSAMRSVTDGSRPIYGNDGFPLGHNCLAFVVEPEGWRICIDTQDRARVHHSALEWCHVYGKVNVDPATQSVNDRRIVPVGPSFGLRVWGPIAAAVQAARSHRIAGARITNPRWFYKNFYRQWRYRLPLDDYQPALAQDGFVFFLASLWADDPECNASRATFLRSCRSRTNLRLEGGFAPRSRNDVKGFEELTVRKRYTLRRYIRGVKRSLFVFNTPAVLGCLGWKLAEFLALGKAIISLPLNRELPAPLEHGRHVHFVDGTADSIGEAIDRLASDQAYRRHLEVEARAYFESYLRPDRVLHRLVEAAARR